jgi:hypothetical protein
VQILYDDSAVFIDLFGRPGGLSLLACLPDAPAELRHAAPFLTQTSKCTIPLLHLKYAAPHQISVSIDFYSVVTGGIFASFFVE